MHERVAQVRSAGYTYQHRAAWSKCTFTASKARTAKQEALLLKAAGLLWIEIQQRLPKAVAKGGRTTGVGAAEDETSSDKGARRRPQRLHDFAASSEQIEGLLAFGRRWALLLASTAPDPKSNEGVAADGKAAAYDGEGEEGRVGGLLVDGRLLGEGALGRCASATCTCRGRASYFWNHRTPAPRGDVTLGQRRRQHRHVWSLDLPGWRHARPASVAAAEPHRRTYAHLLTPFHTDAHARRPAAVLGCCPATPIPWTSIGQESPSLSHPSVHP